jgi:hypothetical protein
VGLPRRTARPPGQPRQWTWSIIDDRARVGLRRAVAAST